MALKFWKRSIKPVYNSTKTIIINVEIKQSMEPLTLSIKNPAHSFTKLKHIVETNSHKTALSGVGAKKLQGIVRNPL